jgi:hypothetical protein
VNIVPKWAIVKSVVNGKVQYRIYRRWLGWNRLYEQCDTKEEAKRRLLEIEQQINPTDRRD